jgi:outer membrane receptor protein involved in Fe transport
MKRFLKACLLCGASGLIGTTLATANAQETPPAQDGAEERTLDTVVVNARKTDEALTDVPVSVNALTAEQISDRVLDKFDDFIRATPGTTVVNAGPDYNTDISIRGQGGGRNGFTESATGIYRNGVYVAGGGFGGRTYNRLDLFDVEQFEVYRGPQGALYGRNAVGGAVNVITARPDPEAFSGRVTLNYDERERTTLEGVANVPLGTGGSALRLAGLTTDQSGGFITNTVTGATLDTEELYGLRGSVLLALTPEWSVTLTAERYENQDSPGFSDLGRRLPGTNAAAAFDPDPFRRVGSRSGRVRIEETTFFAELDGMIGENTLTGVLTTKNRDARRFNEDLDKFLGQQGVGASDLSVVQSEDFDRLGAEIRLASPSDRAWRWLVGVDYQSFEDELITANEGTSNIANLRELGQRTDLSTEDLTSFSVFGLVEADLGTNWTITGELRALTDERDFLFSRTDRVPTPVNGSIAPVLDTREDTAVLPVVTVKRSLGEDAQVYARVATGFRPGGFNAGTGNVDALGYEPENALAGELGYKANLAGWQVSTAVYYQRSDDLQIVTTVSTTDTTTVLQNIPQADYYGFEAEVSKAFEVGPGRLNLNGSFSTADGEFGSGSVINVNGTAIDISGDPVNRVRDYQVSLNGNYAMPLGGGWRGFANVTATAEGGGFENATGGGNRPTGRVLEDFERYDIRLGVDNGRLRASLFVQNISDEVVVLQTVNQNEFYSTPRIVGGEITVRWGQ